MTAPPLLRWLAGAQRGWGWRQLALAVFVGSFCVYDGGSIFGDWLWKDGWWQPFRAWAFNVLQFGVPWVYAMRVVDRAVEAGVRAWPAYGVALAVTLAAGIWIFGNLIVLALGGITWSWDTRNDLILALGRILSLGTLTFMHATWRGEQRTLAALRRLEIEQAARRRAVETARLLALQARVEPEFLFDTLGRVNRLARRSTVAADRLLMALTNLLRALQGGGAQAASSLERELALVSAYARTSARSGLRPPRLRLSATAQARATAMAPGVLLPLLRDLARRAPSHWRLDAKLGAAGLAIVVTAAPADAAARRALAQIDRPTLLARLRSVHGPGADLEIADTEANPDPACALHLHLPVPDDRQGPDR